MKLYNYIKNKVPRITFEKKGLPKELFYSYGANNNNYKLSTYMSLVYYTIISALATGIDLIGDEFETINPVIFDKTTKEFDRDSNNNPLIELLTLPNSDQTKTEFFGSIIRYLNITGNSFIVATGDINRPPLELISIDPTTINIEKSSKDAFAQLYTYQTDNVNIVFNRIEENGRFRFVNKEEGFELWHIRDFNPNTNDKLWGLSRLNAIYLEIDQFFSSNKHNLSLLKKGVRASGVLSTESTLTTDQRNNIKAQLHESNQGDVNAGNVFLFSGGKFDFKEMSQTLKDMDFKNLKKDMKEDIYNRLKIPLPLISTTNQKFENIFQAKLGLYDNTVIPFISKIFNEFGLFLFPRFGMDPKKEKLWFNLFEIPVLRTRHIKETTELYKNKIISLNESRGLIYLDEIEGGDTIYIPIAEVPIGSNKLVEEKSLKLKEELKKIKYKNGKSVYDIGE